MKDDAIVFCQTCRYAYEAWAVHMHLFEGLLKQIDLDSSNFLKTGHGSCFMHLRDVSLQHWCLQIAKLHDPPNMAGNTNLSIPYFRNHGGWSPEEKNDMEKIVPVLNRFYKKIKSARDKIFVHNDRDTYVNDTIHGTFPEGWDEEYFKKLGEFADLVWTKWVRYTEFQYQRRDFDFSLCPPDDDPDWPANQAKQLREIIIGGILV